MINEQIAAAKKIGTTNGMIPVICESKLTINSRKSWFSFHFEKPNAVEVGKTYSNADGSIFKVIEIIA